MHTAILEALPDLVVCVRRDGTHWWPLSRRWSSDAPGTRLADPGSNLLVLRCVADALDSGLTRTVEVRGGRDDRRWSVEVRVVPLSNDEAVCIIRDRPVAQGETGAAARTGTDRGGYGLTQREITVLRHMANGLADKEIAERMGLSVHTARKHVANILAKMHAPSRTAAALRAEREGLLDCA
ncbi:MAG: response regulator transcription factor [Dehalococcoidia bacterium]|nr:response regulator transcription factor [Dehalococcoidia bacterium]